MQQDCEIDVRFFAPPPEFDGCFTTFYRVTFTVPDGGRVVDYLQPEWANLRIFTGDLPISEVSGGERVADARFTITGPSSRPVRFEMGTARMWGVGLFPLGWARFVRLQASDHANHLYDAEERADFARFMPMLDIMGKTPDDEAEFAKLIEFFRMIDEPVVDAEAIRGIHSTIVDADVASVGEIAERADLSVRALERSCAKHFGFPPKLLLRRQRVMRSLAAFMLAGESNWKSAIDTHYHDHAHFTREFREFMRMTPSEYAAVPHPVLGAFMAERKRVLGSPAQTLDKPRRT